MLNQALGGTLGLGTNFVAGTLYSGLGMWRARVVTQSPNYDREWDSDQNSGRERDSDPNYLRSDAFRVRVVKYH